VFPDRADDCGVITAVGRIVVAPRKKDRSGRPPSTALVISASSRLVLVVGASFLFCRQFDRAKGVTAMAPTRFLTLAVSPYWLAIARSYRAGAGQLPSSCFRSLPNHLKPVREIGEEFTPRGHRDPFRAISIGLSPGLLRALIVGAGVRCVPAGTGARDHRLFALRWPGPPASPRSRHRSMTLRPVSTTPGIAEMSGTARRRRPRSSPVWTRSATPTSPITRHRDRDRLSLPQPRCSALFRTTVYDALSRRPAPSPVLYTRRSVLSASSSGASFVFLSSLRPC